MNFTNPSIRDSNQVPIGSRRDWLRTAGAGVGLAATLMSVGGCVPSMAAERIPDLVWGRRGVASDGLLFKPRAMTIDEKDEIYIVDLTGEGASLRYPTASTCEVGKLRWLNKESRWGWRLAMTVACIVSDTHYFRVLFYSRDGVLDETRTIGGVNGDLPGQFQFVTDTIQAKNGHYFVGHYGQSDMIQEFDEAGKFVRRWGSQGNEPGQFSRPQTLLLDKEGLLWIADACNHRIQVFDVAGPEPKLERIWGAPGMAVGELQYPYGMDFDADGTLLIAEFGAHRVQRFSREGKSLEVWGSAGKLPGQFTNPWALIVDSRRRLHVLDTMNHRVQRFQL